MILVTGGAGYIGSHTSVELIKNGYDIVILDNLCNSKYESINRIIELTGKEVPFEKVDLLDYDGVKAVFEKYDIDAVIHFAGLKAVGESVEKPMLYYNNNITGTLNLLRIMNDFGCKKIVFSSSATVYGITKVVPVTEDMPTGTTNPYGSTKLMLENILRDISISDNDWSIVLLRYFNPIGAHESGRIGEDPNGIPNNLVPYIAQVAVGKLEKLNVFGDDYATPDGTGVRDYIHVVDLAKGHVAALKKLETKCGLFIVNLGTGKGYSVLDVLHAYEKACGKTLPYIVAPRREGDIAECYAEPAKARDEMGWEAKLGIEEMCASSWKWQSGNPNGYKN